MQKRDPFDEENPFAIAAADDVDEFDNLRL